MLIVPDPLPTAESVVPTNESPVPTVTDWTADEPLPIRIPPSVVEPVPPLPTVRVPRVKAAGEVPEHERNPPGQLTEMTPLLLMVKLVPPISEPGVPVKLTPVPDDREEVAVLYKVPADVEFTVPAPRVEKTGESVKV